MAYVGDGGQHHHFPLSMHGLADFRSLALQFLHRPDDPQPHGASLHVAGTKQLVGAPGRLRVFMRAINPHSRRVAGAIENGDGFRIGKEIHNLKPPYVQLRPFLQQ